MDNRNSDNRLDRLRKIPIRVTVRVCGRSLRLDELLSWTPGTMLSFDQLASSPLTLCVDEREIGEGQAVKIGSKVGFRIHSIRSSSTVNAGMALKPKDQ